MKYTPSLSPTPIAATKAPQVNQPYECVSDPISLSLSPMCNQERL